MKTSIIRIGNSRGIRIPKTVFAQCGFEEEVEMEVNGRELILHSPRRPRENWDAAFAQMAKRKDDRLLDASTSTSWDDKEWEW